MTNSLKANKVKQHSPSKAEVILTDNQKLGLASVTGEANKAFTFYIKNQEATQAYETAEEKLADDWYSHLIATKPDYATYQAEKKHITQSVADSTKRKFETVENWLNKSVIKSLKALGFVPPKAESKAAEGMAKLRAELSAIDDDDLVTQIAELAKAGDKDSLKRATQLASEKQKREAQATKAIARADGKATTELKKALKTWIGGLDTEQLAALVWAKNHMTQITKLSKQ